MTLRVIMVSLFVAFAFGFFTSEEKTFLERKVSSAKKPFSAADLLLGNENKVPANKAPISTHSENTRMLELSMRGYEATRFNEVANRLKNKGYSVKGFYHTSSWQEHWQGVIEEQLEIMDGRRARLTEKVQRHGHSHSGVPHWASLLDIATDLHMSVAGVEEDFEKISKAVRNLDLRNGDKISMHRYDTIERFSSKEAQTAAIAKHPDVSSGEYPTIRALSQHCKAERDAGRKAMVYYVHNKGGCCTKATNNPVGNWRDMMNAFVLEFPSICMRALEAGYSTCGPAYQTGHYSGNFWWADCEHVADLSIPHDRFAAHDAEYYILTVTRDYGHDCDMAENCGYNPFHCKVNHYDFLCPRSRYQGVILNNLLNDELPPNPTHTYNNNTLAFVQHQCSRLRALPSNKKKDWHRDVKRGSGH